MSANTKFPTCLKTEVSERLPKDHLSLDWSCYESNETLQSRGRSFGNAMSKEVKWARTVGASKSPTGPVCLACGSTCSRGWPNMSVDEVIDLVATKAGMKDLFASAKLVLHEGKAMTGRRQGVTTMTATGMSMYKKYYVLSVPEFEQYFQCTPASIGIPCEQVTDEEGQPMQCVVLDPGLGPSWGPGFRKIKIFHNLRDSVQETFMEPEKMIRVGQGKDVWDHLRSQRMKQRSQRRMSRLKRGNKTATPAAVAEAKAKAAATPDTTLAAERDADPDAELAEEEEDHAEQNNVELSPSNPLKSTGRGKRKGDGKGGKAAKRPKWGKLQPPAEVTPQKSKAFGRGGRGGASGGARASDAASVAYSSTSFASAAVRTGSPGSMSANASRYIEELNLSEILGGAKP
eukprot:1754289-Amphidinium_carterae.3